MQKVKTIVFENKELFYYLEHLRFYRIQIAPKQFKEKIKVVQR